ncbi:MAG: PAS domain-containing protein [Limisphaerales bacterium]
MKEHCTMELPAPRRGADENRLSGGRPVSPEQNGANANDLLQVLLANIPDAIYFKDRNSRFVELSKSFCQLFGVKDPEVIRGKTDFDFFTEEHARPAFDDEQEIVETGKPVIGKLEKETHRDGRISWALTTKMPWRDGRGRIIGIFGISKDVTALKVAEAELELAHQRLVETSRLAGMAEVASDVLHNVGNTLNSINVSCSLVIDAIKRLSFNNLARIPLLLQENAGRLDEFLTNDPRGKHIPQYLAAIPAEFEEQKRFVLGELGQLREHVDHVNQIVAMQQSYAQVAGVQEPVDIARLVDDAIQINAAALQRHTIEYHRDIEPLPPFLVDKHKVLQILINVIRNAKYALSDSQSPHKLMTVRVRRAADGQVEIQVIDNGIGIPAENLTRIFAHGFTTRRDGHGFGLHSGSLAARELGGALSAHSDGPGKGATFTLTLPFRALKAD